MGILNMGTYYMISKFKGLFISGLIFFFIGCGTAKKVVSSPKPISKIDLSSLIEEVQKAYPKHKSLAIRGTASYTDGKMSEKINVQFRFIENKAIWVNAVMIIPIARLLVTPQEVNFYERFQKTYFQDDFLTVRKVFNNDLIGFTLIENLLMGKSLVDVSKYKWKSIDNPVNYILVPERTKGETIPTLFIDPSSFLLQEQRILVPGTSNTLNIRYLDYINIEGVQFPKTIEISLVEPQSLMQLVIEYKQINRYDEDVAIPFEIPENYTPISFP
ncbi:MAG: DUF4292 domain-containing protein [Flavobacteriaceae bacterium]|nr:DUF4292 domain-containing protein [Flavobacteriaceae bacterium]